MKTRILRVSLIALGLACIAGVQAGPLDIDVRFGSLGRVAVDRNTAGVHVLPDGRLLLISSGESGTAIILTRLLPEGAVDPTYGDSGTRYIPTGETIGYLAIATQSDGPDHFHVLGVGERQDTVVTSIRRFDVDGNPDSNFGTGGVLEFEGNFWRKFSIAEDGSLIVAGDDGYRFGTGPVTAIGSNRYISSVLALGGERFAVVNADRAAWDASGGAIVSPSQPNGTRFELGVDPPSAMIPDPEGGGGHLACGGDYEYGVSRYDRDFGLDFSFGRMRGTFVLPALDLGLENGNYYMRCASLMSLGADSILAVGTHNNGASLIGSVLMIDEIDRLLGPIRRNVVQSPGNPWTSLQAKQLVQSAEDRLLVLAETVDSNSRVGATLLALDRGTAGGSGSVGFAWEALRLSEGGTQTLTLHRNGGSAGSVSVKLEGDATELEAAGVQWSPEVVHWASGDSSPKTVELRARQDTMLQGEREVSLRLAHVEGAASVIPIALAVVVEDDEAFDGLEFDKRKQTGSYDRDYQVRVKPRASSPGPVSVRYFIAGSQQADTGNVSEGYVYFTGISRGQLHWAPGDVSEKIIYVSTLHANTSGMVGPPATMAVIALASSDQMLRDASGWKSAVLEYDRATSPPPSGGGGTSSGVNGSEGNGGGGSFTLLEAGLLAFAIAMSLSRRGRLSSRVVS